MFRNSKPPPAKVPVKKKVSVPTPSKPTPSDTSNKTSSVTSPVTNAPPAQDYDTERVESARHTFREVAGNLSAESLLNWVTKLDALATEASSDNLLENVEARFLLKSIYSYDLFTSGSSAGTKLPNGNSAVASLPKALAKCVKWLSVDKLMTDKSQQWWAYLLGSIATNLSNYDEMFAKITAYEQESEAFLLWMRDVVASKDLRNVFESNKEVLRLIEFYLGSIYNMARIADVRPKLAELNLVESASFYLTCSDQTCQCLALMFIASIVSESDSAKIGDSYGIIPSMTKYLQLALNTEGHNFAGFFAEELLQGVSLILVNDANKEKFVSAGILPILGETLKSGSDEEKLRAVDCLWTLAFGENERKEILKSAEIIESLKELAKSGDENLKRKTKKAIEFIENGKANLSNLTALVGGVKKEKTQTNLKDGGHIFISYCWKNQETCKRIRDLLKAKGFRVWMDIDAMSGSTLEAMAGAIENATAVLMCYSDDYKRSPNCRTEAEYTFQLQKPFLPVNMQRRYRPDGWLGLILGAKFYVDMSLVKTPFEDAAQKLMQELSVMLKIQSSQEPSQPSTHNQAKIVDDLEPSVSSSKLPAVDTQQQKKTQEVVVDTVGKKMLSVSYVRSKVSDWTSVEVKSWLEKQSLVNMTKVLNLVKDMNGCHLAVIYEMKMMAPDIFYSSLLTNCALVDVLKFSEALERLPTTAV